MRLDGMTWGRVPGQCCTGLGVATCVVILCTSTRTRPPQHCARPLASASAPSSVNLAPTKIRQVRRPAKHVRLERIKIRLSRMIARLVELGNTMTKLERLIVKLVTLTKNQQVIKKPVFSLVCRRRCTKNGRVGDARMGVLVGGGSRRRQRARRELVWWDGMTWGRIPGHRRTVLGVAGWVVVCCSIRRRPPQHRAGPMRSASAPSSVNLAPTKIRQVRRPAKHVRLERIKIRLRRVLAYRAQQVDTPTKSQLQQKTNAKIAGKENLQLNHQALQSFIFLSPLVPTQTPTLSQRH